MPSATASVGGGPSARMVGMLSTPARAAPCGPSSRCPLCHELHDTTACPRPSLCPICLGRGRIVLEATGGLPQTCHGCEGRGWVRV
jgi:hypothetical protein